MNKMNHQPTKFKEKLLALFNYIKLNKKKIFYILLILTLFLSLFINFNKEKLDEKTETLKTADPVISRNNFRTEENNIKNTDQSSYPQNRFDSLVPVTGLKFDGNKIIYTTNKGIYNLWGNEQILNVKIDKIQFAKINNIAIYSSDSEYYLLDILTKNKTSIGKHDQLPIISDTGNSYLVKDQNELGITNTTNLLTKTINNLNMNNLEIGWINLSDRIYLYNTPDNNLEIIDNEGQKILSKKMEENKKFVSISPDLNTIIFFKNNKLLIENSNLNSNISVELFGSNNINTYWIDNEKFIIVEKVDRGFESLYDQFLWIGNINGEIKYIANSLPVINKLNLDNGLQINKEKTVLIVSENNGKIWAFSLVPEQLPTYTESGVSFYNLPNLNREAE